MGGSNSKTSNSDPMFKKIEFVETQMLELQKRDPVEYKKLREKMNRIVPTGPSRRRPGMYGGSSNTNTTNCTEGMRPFVVTLDENTDLELGVSCSNLYYKDTMIGSLKHIFGSSENDPSSDLGITVDGETSFISVQKLEDLLDKIAEIDLLPSGGKGKKMRSTRIEKWVSTGRKVTIKVGNGTKSNTVKTVYMNVTTKELRVRKLFVAKNGSRKFVYRKFIEVKK